MADVRALLRAERAARVPPKTERKQGPPTASNSKKRKAIEAEDDSRKRTKAEEKSSLPAGFFEETAEAVDDAEPEAEESSSVHGTLDATSSNAKLEAPQPPPTGEAVVDEDEWAAFERDVATPPPSQPKASTLHSSAIISAAPMTAAEIEAQKKEAQKAQRQRREDELEGDKEDAARALEDEFEEMDALEQRVKKLREAREQLRKESKEDIPFTEQPINDHDNEAEDDDDDEEEDDDWGNWGFGRT